MYRRVIGFILLVLLMATPLPTLAQTRSKVEAQRERVEQYRKDLDAAKKELSNLRKEKGSASRRVDALNKQMNLRSNYIEQTEREKELVVDDINRVDSLVDSLTAVLKQNRALYAEAVRVAHRNYRQSNYSTYIFSSKGLSDASRRMAEVQHIADQRKALADSIMRQEQALGEQRELLSHRRHELDSITLSLEQERRSLADDKAEAQRSYKQLSDKEKRALKNQQQQQRRLDNALAELRKLTEGNKAGASFSDKTKDLNLPVVGGSVEKVQGNMATIVGKKGSGVRSIYEGKVIRLAKDNTNHQMVFIAHGQYISVYTHLGSVSVKENQTVKRDQQIGTIGIGIDHSGAQKAYMQFMINHADPNKRMAVMDCFKK